MVVVVCMVLVLACIAVYGQTLSFKFLNYDDNLYVAENPCVQAGLNLKAAGWAFTTNRALYFHPLTWMSHALDCSLYGLHPWGHHLTNLVFHSAASVLLFVALRLLTGALWRSAAVAALFAIHPIHVESVAWIAERKDVLSAFFWMLALCAYGLFSRRGGAVRYAAVMAAFILGLMSKPMVVTLPSVLLLLDVWPLGRVDLAATATSMTRKAARLALEKFPLFLIAAISAVSTLLMQEHGNNLSFGEKVPFAARCANAIVVYVLYLLKMAWPSGLAPYYPHPLGRPAWQIAGAAVLLAAITLFCLKQARKRPYLIVGWFWYLGTLFPVIELVQAGDFSHADRYTYLPSIGVCIIAVWGAADLAGILNVSRQVIGAVTGAMLTALAACAVVQTNNWRDDWTLFQHAVSVGAESHIAYTNLGKVAAGQGRDEEAKVFVKKALAMNPNYVPAILQMSLIAMSEGRRDEAGAFMKRALELNPREGAALNNLGLIALNEGRREEAKDYLNKALGLEHDQADALNNLGLIAMEEGRREEARNFLASPLRLKPNNADALNNLGKLAMDEGRYDEAMVCLNKALELKPDQVDALMNLGMLCMDQGRMDEAEVHMKKAVGLAPKDVKILANLGALAMERGRYGEADSWLKKALELNPNDANVLNNLEKIAVLQKHYEEAGAYLGKALAASPNHVDALNNLGVCLMYQGRSSEAEPLFRKALEVAPHNVDALANLGSVLDELGRKNEADVYFRKKTALEQTRTVEQKGGPGIGATDR